MFSLWGGKFGGDLNLLLAKLIIVKKIRVLKFGSKVVSSNLIEKL